MSNREFWIYNKSLDLVDHEMATGVVAYTNKPDQDLPSTLFVQKAKFEIQLAIAHKENDELIAWAETLIETLEYMKDGSTSTADRDMVRQVIKEHRRREK